MSNNGQDNRRSFRIEESASVSYEKVSDLEFSQGLDRWKLAKGSSIGVRSKLLDIDSRFNQKLFALKTESVALAECLGLLNDKIATLMEEMPDMKASKESLVRKPPQACELSGDGMRFGVEEPLQPDTKLMIRFLLSADNLYVETFCRVVRAVPPPADSSTAFPHGVAVEFVGMKPELKDILIQHLFDRESETLRMRRLDMEAEELKALRGDK